MPRIDGPFEVLERADDNAYKVNFSEDYGVSSTSNMANLSPYLEDDHLANLRANSLQHGKDDGGPSMESTSAPQNSKGNLGSSTKVQGIVQALLRQSSAPPGFEPVHKPNFVYLIS